MVGLKQLCWLRDDTKVMFHTQWTAIWNIHPSNPRVNANIVCFPINVCERLVLLVPVFVSSQ